MPLNQALSDIKGWKATDPVLLDSKTVTALNLDDYINRYYSNGHEMVSLYIGYYLTSRKVGAAHSPLVCFPGQGWTILSKEKRALDIQGNEINLMSMILAQGLERQLVLYWFQAFDKTSAGTFLQKAHTLLAKLLHARGDNAFVRVSVPIHENALDKALITGTAFIEAFYPTFLEYVKTAES